MNVPSWYLDTPAGKVMLSELASAREVERRDVLDRLTALDAERTKTAPVVAKKVAEAREKLTVAQAALRKAELSYSLALSASHGASAAHDYHRNALLAKARALRPEVTAFANEMRNLLQATRDVQVLVEPYPDGTHANRMIAATNMKSHLARVNAIQAALKEAEAMYLSDAAEDLPQRFAALRDAIPEIKAPGVELVAA